MEITFLGGADEVGASSILIEIAGRRLLVDAGIRPTPKARWGLVGDQLPDLSHIERTGGIDAILVTHAHTDHTGALELVAERYPHVPIYATPVTVELTRVLHQDAQRIMQQRLEEEGELPLYDEVATGRLLAAFVPVTFKQPLTLAPGLTATFFLAGHIAGAAMIGLASAEGRILISGDISISPQRTVDGARPPAFAPDVLILESTYGGRLHANRHAEERRLVETVAEITAGGGKVLIPAFALGRAQEILLTLGEAQRRGELATVPIWADGMVRAVCQAYSAFPEALPLPLQELGATFYTEQIQPVASAAQRNALIWEPGPAVIVASSGMLAGGPSLAYARALAGQPQNAILLTGYQDEEAPGRRLQELATRGRGTLRVGKDKIDVQCRIVTYSLSAHADTGQLVSFTETLDPTQVFLVHGDDDARNGLATALRARGRRVRLPRAGQSFGFRFTPLVRPAPGRGIGRGAAVELRRLWDAVQQSEQAQPADDEPAWVTQTELGQLWWGEDPGPTTAQLDALAAQLQADNPYFAADPVRPAVYRVHSASQVELSLRRRSQLANHGSLEDRWLLVRNLEGEAQLTRVLAVGSDQITVVGGTGSAPAADEPFTVWPEEILAVLENAADAPVALERLAAALTSAVPAQMEPNQALALASQLFPPAARLRRTGYRLADHVLVLTFDFPDTVQREHAAAIAELAAQSGWQVEIIPEANQAALSALVNECLPAGWEIRKGPSIYRAERRVAVTIAPPRAVAAEQLAQVALHYAAVSGYALALSLAAPPAAPRVLSLDAAAAGEQLEINAAYAAIRQALAGSTLYRTSLKDGAIWLSFIAPQVGERYQAEIDQLAQQIGWPLRINPQPNQAAILDVAQRLLQARQWRVVKGPSIFMDRGAVSVTLDAEPTAEEAAALQAEFMVATGYVLNIILNNGQPVASAPAAQLPAAAAVEIPIAQIRVAALQQGQPLNSAKLDNALARARRDGAIHPPISVRRLRDGYLLVDGLYRLRAAQALGFTRVAAVVEN